MTDAPDIQPKTATGRPCDFTPGLATAICTRIADGESLRAICRGDDMPDKATVFRWLSRQEVEFLAFRDQYARACEVRADTVFEEILEIADDNSRDVTEDEDGNEIVDHDHINRSRLRVDARKWMLGKMQPKKYGERIVNEHSGPGGGPIQTVTSAMSAKEAAEAYAATMGEGE